MRAELMPYPNHFDTLDCYCGPTAYWLCDCLHEHLKSGKTESEFLSSQTGRCGDCEGSGYVRLSPDVARGKLGSRLVLSHTISAEEMASRREHCRRCGQLLDKWGEHPRSCMPRKVTSSKAVPTPTKVSPVEVKLKAVRPVRRRERGENSLHARMLAKISVNEQAPTSANDIASALDISMSLAGVMLCVACKAAEIRRVDRGRYVRAA